MESAVSAVESRGLSGMPRIVVGIYVVRGQTCSYLRRKAPQISLEIHSGFLMLGDLLFWKPGFRQLVCPGTLVQIGWLCGLP